jgi:hypothetical protein
MSSKRPPKHLIEKIYAACAEKRRGIEIVSMLGLPNGTVKPAISWMLENGYLIGHRGGSKTIRYRGYMQGSATGGHPMNEPTLENRMDFSALMECFPLHCNIKSLSIGSPSFVHEMRG